MFRITSGEWDQLQMQIAETQDYENLQPQIATAKRRTLPFVFTEQGVSMLSAVLHSDKAIQVSIQIMQAFVRMRQFLVQNASVFQRLDRVELKLLQTDEKIDQIFRALNAAQTVPDKGIFFDGQVFDAYVLVSGIIRKANEEIILIDNYVDESVLTLLSKRRKSVCAVIYTRTIGSQLRLDLQKYNKQYAPISIKELKSAHDRFLIIDRRELYHIGASLKDLGQKWFAFSKINDILPEFLAKLPELSDRPSRPNPNPNP